MKSRLLIGGVELKCHFNGVGVNLHDRDIQTFSFTLRSCMLLARVLAAFGNQDSRAAVQMVFKFYCVKLR